MTTVRRPLLAMLGAGILGCLVVIRVFHDAILARGPSVCAFRQITGRDCIFCGLTRAVASAEFGQWRTAFSYHPLWPLALAGALAFASICFADVWTGGERTHALMRFFMRNGWRVAFVLLVLSFIRGVWLPSHVLGAPPAG